MFAALRRRVTVPLAVAALLAAGAAASECAALLRVTAPYGQVSFLRGHWREMRGGPIALSVVTTDADRFAAAGGAPHEAFQLWTVDDGRGEPVRFARPQHFELAQSLAWTPDRAFIPFQNQVGLVTELAVVDRRARSARRYFFEGQFIAATDDARFFLAHDVRTDRVTLYDGALADIQNVPLPAGEFVRRVGAFSPDGKYAAFFTFSPGYPREVFLHAYVYSVPENRLVRLGDYRDLGELEWRDNLTVVNVTHEVAGGRLLRIERQVFRLTQ